jgi:hypothetical protein
MRIGARLASAKFALFSWLSSASRTTNRQGLFPFGCHVSIMQGRSATRCAILISSFIFGPGILARFPSYNPLRILCERY